MDESDFDYNYVPEHLAEKVRNWINLSVGERLVLTSELSVAAWAKIGVVRDPNKPMDKTIRRLPGRRNDGRADLGFGSDLQETEIGKNAGSRRCGSGPQIKNLSDI